VEPGQEGELVVTNLGRWGSPLIRYRTGDLVKAATDASPSGRSWLHLDGGILGRADDMLTIRGNNVFPSSLEAILRQFDEVAEYRVEVRTEREMHHLKLEIEPVPEALTNAEALLSRIRRTIKDRLNFHPDVVAVPSGSLPRFELKGQRFFRSTE
jgi:phenylacetate-CoA ligase